MEFPPCSEISTMALDDNDLLYHYTTPDGLIGIVENRTLWATDVFYLNDSKEFALGIQIARDYMRDLKDRENSECTVGRLEWLMSQFKDIGPLRKKTVYVSSLSVEDDLLSQWRAYCGGGGFAIGFKVGSLKELAAVQGFVLERCIYEPGEQNQIISEAVDSIAKPWLNSNAPWPEQPGEGPRFDACNKLVDELSRLSPILKNQAFHEENEYRLISEPSAHFVEGQKKFRAQRGLVVPYRDFKLNNSDLWRQVRAVVGPTPHPEQSKASVYALLRGRDKNGCAHDVQITECSYREW